MARRGATKGLGTRMDFTDGKEKQEIWKAEQEFLIREIHGQISGKRSGGFASRTERRGAEAQDRAAAAPFSAQSDSGAGSAAGAAYL